MVELPPNGAAIPLNQDLAITQFYKQASQVGTLLAGGTQDNGTNVFEGKLPLLGNNTVWTQIMGGDGGNTVINPDNPKQIYAEYFNGALKSTNDGGKTWQNVAPQTLAVDFIMPFIVPGKWNTIIAGGESVFLTNTGGVPPDDNTPAWRNLGPWPSPDPQDSNPPYITTLWASSDAKTIVAGRNDGSLAKVFTDTNPRQWAFDDRRGLPIESVVLAPEDNNHAFMAIGSTYIKPVDTCDVIEASDFGRAPASWHSIRGDLPDCNAAVLGLFGKRLFIGTERSIYEYLGNGHWRTVGNDFPIVRVVSLIFAPPQSLIALTHGRGAWYLPDVNP
jgi:hypothetical protein